MAAKPRAADRNKGRVSMLAFVVDDNRWRRVGNNIFECGLTVYMALQPCHVVGKAGQGACELLHNEMRVDMLKDASSVTFLNGAWSRDRAGKMKLGIG